MLWLAVACFGLFWLALAALAACAFRSIAAQVLSRAGSFFALVAHCFDFLTHLKLSCIRVTFFCDFASILDGFREDLGRILGGFFEDFLRFS